MRLADYLSKDEVRAFTKLSDLKGFQAVATTWFMIFGAFALVAFFPNWWAILIALVIIGGRQLALAILTHDCSHYSLFDRHHLNDFLGTWFCGNPVWVDLRRYRAHHLRHHQYAGTEKDPDLDLVSGYPVTKTSMIRKFLRDLSGITGLKRIYGLLLMDFGFIQFTVSNNVTRIDQKGRTTSQTLRTGAKNITGVVLANFFLFAVLLAVGHPELYLLWIVAYLTTFSMILRIRSIAEHACTEMDSDPRKSTRTTYASPLGRITVAPHRVNYHLEHHMLMATPYFRLPELHRKLMERGAYSNAYIAKSYAEVLKIATASGQ